MRSIFVQPLPEKIFPAYDIQFALSILVKKPTVMETPIITGTAAGTATAAPPKFYQKIFTGNGSDLFKIQIVNLLLTIVTLGLYYPWAKARTLQYIYGSSEFEGSPFQFHGTGREMFIGFIKALGFIIVIYGIFFAFAYMEMPLLAFLAFYFGLTAIIPLAIHGSYRYRMSRTSWRGIRFGYRGIRNELVKLVYRDMFLTLITLGIYGAWFTVNLRNYVLSNVRFGSAKFNWQGEGGSFFWLNFKGYILTLLTLGIYSFWWQKQLFEYYVNNLWIEKDDKRITFQSKATAGGFFVLTLVNLLLILFTFGLGAPWAIVRTIRFVFENIEMQGDIDLEQIVQTEQAFKDATGEDLADFFDFDFVI